MRILQVCSKVPYPPVDGGTRAMYALAEGLMEHGSKLKIIAISTPKHPFINTHYNTDFAVKTGMETVDINTDANLLHAFINLFHKSSYNIDRFYSPKFEKKLIEILKNNVYDIVLLESLYTSPYLACFRRYSNAKVVLRSHNIEYKLWEQRAASEKNILLSNYFQLLAKKLKNYETEIIPKFDAIFTITDKDKTFFEISGAGKPVFTIPFGVNIHSYEPYINSLEKFPSCFHIGSMDWQPNIEGVKWLMNEVWDSVNKLYPDVKLVLAGRNMPADFKSDHLRNIEVIGEVNDSAAFMRSNGIMLVPLLSGSGMRVKIIEGMAAGKTIISTVKGAEGIPAEHKKNILIARDAKEFSALILEYVNNPEKSRSIGINARIFAEEHFDNSRICADALKFCRQIIAI